ncbi:hypothetical protein [Bradyrhizobium cenepequi]|uniref:hypothetical protein n=1 Tax=Bradyrhizobium cenepequi TaxID=2821403 RepID=UPI001CE35028|nr:hypothetical protein [Bradyrhizobium cenepequi]MCA6111136.1 hypothetical protein [Bradyrhizobium cenepequi]
MAQLDNLKLSSATYDSQNELAHLSFSGWRGGKPIACNCTLHVETPGDLPESQVQAAIKKEAAKLLSELAALL